MRERPPDHSIRPAPPDDHTRPAVFVDLLSAVLREMRFESAAYRWLELGAPFRISFDQPHLHGVHIIARGQCELVRADGTVNRLGTGDLVIFPQGETHVLCSPAPGSGAAVSPGGGLDAGIGGTVSGFELARRTPGTRMRAGRLDADADAGVDADADAEPDAIVVCGAFFIGEPDHPALRGLPRVIHLPGEAGRPPRWLAALVDALSAEAFDGGPGSDLVMARLSDALLIRALRHHSAAVDQPGWLAGLRDPYVAAALAALHADPARPWTLGGLAGSVGLSRAAFAARFTDRVGEPAMRYLLSLRMQRARKLLRDEHATVAAVAAQVGYRSEVAFAAAFKREVGTSPGAYRRSGA